MAYELQIRNSESRVKIRSPWAAALLPIVTLGIYHLVWWYRINCELRDYGRARGYDLGQNPTNSVLAVFPGALIIVPAMIDLLARDQAGPGGRAPRGTGAGQRLDRADPLRADLARLLGLPSGRAERRVAYGGGATGGPDGATGRAGPDAAAPAPGAAGRSRRVIELLQPGADSRNSESARLPARPP